MRCPQCQTDNPPMTRFCRRCGAELKPGARRPKVVIALFVAALLAGVVLTVVLLLPRASSEPATTAAPPPPEVAPQPTTVGVAYGTEKQDWLTWAASEFARTPAGQNIKIDLKPMGSLEAAHAIVKGDTGIDVWSPASSLYKDAFVRDWKAAHSDAEPIAQEAALALTPMVFVAWEQRYDAFVKHYGQMNFRTVSQAVQEKGGWETIANQPEWMFFKFSHTDPASSNSGLMTLVLMGYDYHKKHAGLDGHDVTDPAFEDWISSTEHGLSGFASGLNSSTGYLMTSMVQRGWSTYDVIFVYEAVAIDRLRQANGRWGPLKVVYPPYNMWNENPYYILDAPWSSAQQRQAARAFLDFLLSEPAQQQAMAHGFRPANVQIPTNGPDSPFVMYQNVGLRSDVPGVFCEPPKAEVIENLLLAWERSRAQTR